MLVLCSYSSRNNGKVTTRRIFLRYPPARTVLMSAMFDQCFYQQAVFYNNELFLIRLCGRLLVNHPNNEKYSNNCIKKYSRYVFHFLFQNNLRNTNTECMFYTIILLLYINIILGDSLCI